ncbi:coiled-coil domain-containing protein 89 [Bombina bombina]|uniref:coiled-coil domain-containing protein 89 n=1 Tax=Bombina bombina TaxID=8345 RepID=UPI00235A8B7E|nr:coiled-coil domain-containing protein 89 [Bombina bombina]
MPGATTEDTDGACGDCPPSKPESVPWDEKTENNMLRSRLDEQSQLICLLKRRADDTLLKCQTLEKLNEELEKKGAQAEALLRAERKRGDQLEDRFGVLASNHQDMIRFKDEYKKQNEELKKECQQLRENRFPELLEKERSVKELRVRLETVESELREQRVRHEKETVELKGRREQLLEQIQDQDVQLGALTQRLKDSEELYCKAQEQLSCLEEKRRMEEGKAAKILDEVKKEKEGLLQLSMERGKILQERQREISELNIRLQNAEKASHEAKERYQRDAAAVDVNARVVDLRKRLEENEKELVQLTREFEAYKKHSVDLLSRERELNAKLRHLIG